MADFRHKKRAQFMQQVFSNTFNQDAIENALAQHPEDSNVHRLLSRLESIDTRISAVAAERPLSEISKVDLAILRTIVFESEEKNTPPKVLVNEAVELAKEFGGEQSSKFVNAVLAAILLD